MTAKGFTLIEVILVILILAIAIPSLVMGVGYITKKQVETLGTTTAVNLARERLEEIIADKRSPILTLGFDNIIPANYTDEIPVTGLPYNRTVNIICVVPPDLETDAGCPTDYKRVQVRVQAVGVGASVPDAVLVTLLANY